MESNIIEGFNLDETMQTIDFVDEQREEGSAKKHKLTILNQTPSEILADIEYVGNIVTNGTPINAEVMALFQETILKNEQKANTAIRNAHSAEIVSSYANITSKEASDTASEANEIALNAIEKAEKAEEYATRALEQIAQMQGTTNISPSASSFNAGAKLVDNYNLQSQNKYITTNGNQNISASNVISIGNIMCYGIAGDNLNEYSLVLKFPEGSN